MLSLRCRGLPVSISTDGGPLLLGRMDEAVKAAWRRLNEMNADPTEVQARGSLAMATGIPTEGLCWSGSVGSLEPGKNADMVLVNWDDGRCLSNPRLEGVLPLDDSADVDCVIDAVDAIVDRRRFTCHDEDLLRKNYPLDSLASFSQWCLGISPDVHAQLRKPVGQGRLL